MANLKDSGTRATWGDAQRDASIGKGLPYLANLDICGCILNVAEHYIPKEEDETLHYLNCAMYTGDIKYIVAATLDGIYHNEHDYRDRFIDFLNEENGVTNSNPNFYETVAYALYQVMMQYEDGAKKYEIRNWEHGLPLSCFVNSGYRHYIKMKMGLKDEPHYRAFLWNMIGLIWAIKNDRDELLDLPFCKPDQYRIKKENATENLYSEIKDGLVK